MKGKPTVNRPALLPSDLSTMPQLLDYPTKIKLIRTGGACLPCLCYSYWKSLRERADDEFGLSCFDTAAATAIIIGGDESDLPANCNSSCFQLHCS